MKKIFGAGILVIALTLAVMTGLLSLAAGNSPAYEISDRTVEKGESFSVVVSLKNNPGIISLRFEVEYDETLLRLDSAEDLGLLEGYFPPAPATKSPYMLRWSVSNAENSTASGELVKLNFTAIADDSAESAETEIKISHVEANQSTGTASSKAITFANGKAKIKIENKHTVRFLSDDGETVIAEQKYFPGETLVLPEPPTKEREGTTKYIFTGWTPEVSETVSQDATYTATFTTGVVSTDATLSALSADGVIFTPEFDPNVTEYTAEVPFTVSVLNILCETTSEFATYTVEGAELEYGENTVTVTVIAENGDTKIYTLTVTREVDPDYIESTDSTLKELVPSSGVLSPSFSPRVTDYILYVENSIAEISFVCIANSDKASEVSLQEIHSFDTDTMTITLFCVAEEGNRTEYTVTVVRLPEYNGEIPSFVFGEGDETGDDPIGGDQGTGTDNASSAKKGKNVSVTVIVIVAIASVCAIASVVGIIFLVVSNKKNSKTKV